MAAKFDASAKTLSLSDDVEAAVRAIVRAEHTNRGSIVSLPSRYPSGSSVTIEITRGGDQCFVSDMGQGHLEADLLGASRQFERYASIFAEDAGIRYDGRCLFVAEVPTASLAAAMIVVGDCSNRAASNAAMRAAERAEAEVRSEAYDRIVDVFGKSRVEKDRHVVGASGHRWTVPFFVTVGRGAIFEAVSARSTSVAHTVMRLHDIGRLDAPPPRIILVRSKIKFGDLLGVVSPVSSAVLEISEASSTYERLAA